MKRRGSIGAVRMLLITAVLVQGVTSAAWAGGLWLYERATPEVGTANAGVAARADDASTATSNPAGMSRLEKPELMLGIQPIIGDVKFQPGPGTANINPRGPDGSGGLVTPAASLFYVHPLGKDWRVGVSMGSYMGLGVKYEDDWVGRYYVQQSAFLTANIAPTLSYRVTDWLSIGAALTLQSAYLTNTVALNNTIFGDDGQVEYKGGSFGVGGGAGILVEPWKGTRFGLTYMSPIEHEFKDTPQFSNAISPINQVMAATTGELRIKMTIPQAVMFSVYSQVTENWAVMGNLGWQNWTQFGYTGVRVTSTVTDATVNTTANANYDDTFHIAVGAHYRFHPLWRATAGFAYDSSPAGAADRTVAMPLGGQLRYSAGVIYEPNARFTFGLAYTLIDGGSASIDQSRGPLAGTVQGDFSANYYHVVALYGAARF